MVKMKNENVIYYETDLVKLLYDEINTLLNPYHLTKIKGVTEYDYYVLERAASVLEKLSFMNNHS